MNRRFFLLAAPAIVAAPSLMKLSVAASPLPPGIIEATQVNGIWRITRCEGFKRLPDGSFEHSNTGHFHLILPQISPPGTTWRIEDKHIIEQSAAFLRG